MFKKLKRWANDIGWKGVIHSLFFQRILRINSAVPWPVHFTSWFGNPENIQKKGVKPYLGLSPGCYIQATNGIIIGRNSRIGPGVKMISANHNIYDFDDHINEEPIRIGKDCWIGANAVILPGVNLADHTIVAAGAVVTDSFTQGDCMIGGVPARIIKKIDAYKEK